jgi:hypothetical protein
LTGDPSSHDDHADEGGDGEALSIPPPPSLPPSRLRGRGRRSREGGKARQRHAGVGMR